MSARGLLTLLLALLFLASCGDDDDGGTQPGTDTTDPQVAFLQPLQGANVTAGNVALRAQATDNEAVAKVEFYADAVKIGEDASGVSGVFEFTWNAAGLAAGSQHTLRARAIDTSDNDAEATITVKICPCPAGPTYHDENIDADETWYACCNPHVVTAHLYIENGATLTIQPGCIVRFEPDVDASITCGWAPETGGLIAVGKADSTILFTSNATSPAAGDWHGFGFHEGTFASTRFSYCTIQYAGSPDIPAILLDFGAVVKMDHSTVRYSAGKGISYYQQGSHMTQFTNNTITGCADVPLEVEAEYVRELGAGNSFTGNAAGKDAIMVYQSVVETSGTWLDQGVPYRFPDGHGMGIGHQTGSAVVTIEAGTVIEMGLDSFIEVGYTTNGGLIAEGTESEPIVFTSAQSFPQPGDWRTIYFAFGSIDSQCRMSHCLIEYGGGLGENILIEEALPTITNCAINHSAQWGVTLGGFEHPGATEIEGANTFTGNGSGDVRVL